MNRVLGAAGIVGGAVLLSAFVIEIPDGVNGAGSSSSTSAPSPSSSQCIDGKRRLDLDCHRLVASAAILANAWYLVMILLSVGVRCVPDPDPVFRLVMFYAGLAMWLADSAFGFAAWRIGCVDGWEPLALAVGSLLAILGMDRLELTSPANPTIFGPIGADRRRAERRRLDPARPRRDARRAVPSLAFDRPSLDEPPEPALTDEGAVADDGGAPDEHGPDGPGDLEPLVRRVVARVVEVGGTDRPRAPPGRRATMSASRPTSSAPFRAIPKRRAGVVAIRSTMRSTVIRPRRDALAVDERQQGLDARRAVADPVERDAAPRPRPSRRRARSGTWSVATRSSEPSARPAHSASLVARRTAAAARSRSRRSARVGLVVARLGQGRGSAGRSRP